jgi:hypothetical protein
VIVTDDLLGREAWFIDQKRLAIVSVVVFRVAILVDKSMLYK